MSKRALIDVTWHVEDGYVGGRRPQHSALDPEEFDPELSDDALRAEVYDYVYNDFEDRVTYEIDDVEAIVARIRAYHDERVVEKSQS